MYEKIPVRKLLEGKFAEAGIPLAAFTNKDITVHTNSDGTERVEVKDLKLRLPKKPADLRRGATAKERKAYEAAFDDWLVRADRRVADFGARRKAVSLTLKELSCRQLFAHFCNGAGVDIDFDRLQFKGTPPWIDPLKDGSSFAKQMTWDEVADQEDLLVHYGVSVLGAKEAAALLVAFDRITREMPDMNDGEPLPKSSNEFVARIKLDIRFDALNGKWSSMDLARVEKDLRSFVSQIDYSVGDGFYRGRPYSAEDQNYLDNVVGAFVRMLDGASPEAKKLFLTPLMKQLRPTNVPWKKRAKAVADERAAEHATWLLANPGQTLRSRPASQVLMDEIDRFPNAADELVLARKR